MSKPVLQAKGLTKSYRSATGLLEILRGIDLTVEAGESVSIRGASGAGKTTLLQVLGGLDAPNKGELSWMGRRVDQLRSSALASLRSRQIGFVFQNYQLMPELGAQDNVALAGQIAGMPLAEARTRAFELIKLVGLSSRSRHLPSALSGGECQRVALARALMNRPALLLADEPTGNLDEVTAVEMMNLLLTISREQGAALVLVTHSSEFARLAGRQLVLRAGSLSNA
jgi:lipoprotein-releasing system ATP-binding protein